MPSGVTSAWGDTPKTISGMNNRLFYNTRPLTYDSSLVSAPVKIRGNYVTAPLEESNKSYYSLFGKKRKTSKKKKVLETPKKKKGSFGGKKHCKKRRETPFTKELCSVFLQNGGNVNPLTGRLLKKNGPVYNKIISKCEKYSVNLRPQPQLKNFKSMQTQTNFQPIETQTDFEPIQTKTPKIKKTPTYELNVLADPHWIKVGNTVYTKGLDTCYYNSEKDSGKIIGIGPKVIIVVPSNGTSKVKRITLNDFVRFNTV
jgi:hypothetical protein